jgi:threonine/homoserine/homoserine lactone efflux protein
MREVAVGEDLAVGGFGLSGVFTTTRWWQVASAIVPSADSLLGFAVASIVLLMIPGPAVVFVVNRSVSDGRSVALASVAGLELGNLVHALAATAGLSAIIATSATAFSVVKWAGALYLIGVGLVTLLRPPDRLALGDSRLSHRRAFGQGVIVNVLNPKVALFFLSYLPQFVDPARGAAWRQVLVLGIVFVVLGVLSDSTWAIATSTLRDLLLRGRALGVVRRWVSGSVFVVLGVLAARAHRAV